MRESRPRRKPRTKRPVVRFVPKDFKSMAANDDTELCEAAPEPPPKKRRPRKTA